MTRADLIEMVNKKASDYVSLQTEQALGKINPADGRAYDALAGLLTYKGAAALPKIIGLASDVTPTGTIGSRQIQAAISHEYPSEAIQILGPAMKNG